MLARFNNAQYYARWRVGPADPPVNTHDERATST